MVLLAPIAGVVGLAFGFALWERWRFRRRVAKTVRQVEAAIRAKPFK